MDQKKTLWRDPIGERHPGHVGSATPQVLGGGNNGSLGHWAEGATEHCIEKFHEKIPPKFIKFMKIFFFLSENLKTNHKKSPEIRRKIKVPKETNIWKCLIAECYS